MAEKHTCDNGEVVMTMLRDIQSDTGEIRKDLTRLDNAVRGNGQPGLKTEVAVIKARNRITLGILIPIGLAVITLIVKVAFEWTKASGAH